jgi:hypothetical protein
VTSDSKVYFSYGSNAQVQGGYNVSSKGSTIVSDGAVDFSGTVTGVGSALTVGVGIGYANYISRDCRVSTPKVNQKYAESVLNSDSACCGSLRSYRPL